MKQGSRVDAVVGEMGQTADREAARILAERQLMQAAIAADALFHKLRDQGLLNDADQGICDLLVEAIGNGLKLGF